MNNEINLLYSKKQLRLYQLTTRVRIIRFIALGLLFFICGLSIIFFLFIVASPLSNLKTQEATLTQALSDSKPKIIKQTLLTTRLTDVDVIIARRSQYDSVLKTIIGTVSDGTTIVEYAAEKKVVEVTIDSRSLTDIESCFTKLKALVAAKNIFSQVFMSSLKTTFNTEGSTSGFSAKLILTLR